MKLAIAALLLWCPLAFASADGGPRDTSVPASPTTVKAKVHHLCKLKAPFPGDVLWDWDERLVVDDQVQIEKGELAFTAPVGIYRIVCWGAEPDQPPRKHIWYVTFEAGTVPPITSAPPPPYVGPAPTVPAPVATPADEFASAYATDKAAGRGSAADLKALSRIYANAGEALDRARPPTVGHLRNGLVIIENVQLKQALPTVLTLARRQLALRLPPDATIIDPQTGLAAKLVLLDLAASLEKITP